MRPLIILIIILCTLVIAQADPYEVNIPDCGVSCFYDNINGNTDCGFYCDYDSLLQFHEEPMLTIFEYNWNAEKWELSNDVKQIIKEALDEYFHNNSAVWAIPLTLSTTEAVLYEGD